MRLNEPRIQPLHEDNWTEDQNTIFRGQKMRGEVQNIFRVLANHEKLAKRWLVFGNHILAKSTLPPRDREIVILRTGWLCQSAYEWSQHVHIARRAGMTDEEIARIKEGADADGWTEHERLLITATDELRNDAFITDETWNGLKQNWTDQQMMDLVFTCGQYTMVSMALNSFGVPMDDDLEGF